MDFIEDILVLDGITFRFIDTAGIRDTDDILENMGIERSKQKLREAEMVLFISRCQQTYRTNQTGILVATNIWKPTQLHPSSIKRYCFSWNSICKGGKYRLAPAWRLFHRRQRCTYACATDAFLREFTHENQEMRVLSSQTAGIMKHCKNQGKLGGYWMG